ncbi:MAG: hypothetical protein IJ714_07230 [Bacteroidales bacterium]|nr:hypothetical protein [Bacteroidales bacterium]
MKKLTSVLLTLVMMLVLAACSVSDETVTSEPKAQEAVSQNMGTGTSPLEGKTLVAFFTARNQTEFNEDADSLSSASQTTVDETAYGNAELLAKYAAKATGGDVFSIETVKQYPEMYRETTEVAQEEQNDNARPELKNKVTDMESYENIVLIYPMWWADMPMGVWTFLESYDFSGKTIYPISTHLGSGMGNSIATIQKLVKGADVKDGLEVSGNAVSGAEADVLDYLK